MSAVSGPRLRVSGGRSRCAARGVLAAAAETLHLSRVLPAPAPPPELKLIESEPSDSFIGVLFRTKLCSSSSHGAGKDRER